MKRRSYRLLALAGIATLLVSFGGGCGKTDTPNTEAKEGQQTEDSQKVEDTETEGVGAESTETEEKDASETEEDAVYVSITSDAAVINYESVVVVGNAAFELYTYKESTAQDYAAGINKLADNLAGTAKVYNIVIPLSSGITFPDNLADSIQSSDQKAAVEAIDGMMNDNVVHVPIYDTLMRHREEYIYYRTDHHWTQLGAYYAYEQYCDAKGIEPEALESYATKDFEGFKGSFVNDTDDATLNANPDTIHAYLPNCSSTMHVTAKDNTEYDWDVIYDVTNYKAGVKYSTFIAGDNPYTVITNQEVTDGSSCVVVKESFGNTFVPFLVDHYQYIYVIDYRYWTGSIESLVREKGAQDVIMINNLSMIRNKYLVGQLNGVL